jgi:hypothetical protein
VIVIHIYCTLDPLHLQCPGVFWSSQDDALTLLFLLKGLRAPQVVLRWALGVAQNASDAQAAELQAGGAVELGSMECKAVLEDSHSLSLTALVVVDYSSGGPILPEHEDLWMGTAYACRRTGVITQPAASPGRGIARQVNTLT